MPLTYYLSWIVSLMAVTQLLLMSTNKVKLQLISGCIILLGQPLWIMLALVHKENLGFMVLVPVYTYIGIKSIRKSYRELK